MERASLIPERLRQPFVPVALLAALAWTLSAHSQQAPQTAPRPGETAKGSPATTAGAGGNRAVITGHVLGPDGRPLRQVEIQLSGTLDLQVRRESTDADGRYEAGGLPPDSYTLIASKAGYATMEFGQRRVSY